MTTSLKRAAIVAATRTPVGRFGGVFRDMPVEDLAATAVTATVQRAGLDPELIDDVVLAQSYANSENPCIGRWVAQHAGLPEHVGGQQVDRRCGGGLQAVITAAMMVQTGAAGCVLAGGVESMSRIEHYTTDARWGRRSGQVVLHDRLDRGRLRAQPEWRYGAISGMVETAETLVREFGISREAADAFAARSHHRAAAAQQAGRFDAEIVPVTVRTRDGDRLIDRDEGVRPDTTTGRLASLRPVMPEGTVTAGNAAQQNDAAAACLVVSEDLVRQLGLEPLGYLHSWATVGCDPARMGLGPVPALQRLVERHGLRADTLDLVELNEAFAAQALAVLSAWDWCDEERLNVNGGGIALGHPIGATGVRLMTTALHELARRDGERALVTMCVGGGQGVAAVFER